VRLGKGPLSSVESAGRAACCPVGWEEDVDVGGGGAGWDGFSADGCAACACPFGRFGGREKTEAPAVIIVSKGRMKRKDVSSIGEPWRCEVSLSRSANGVREIVHEARRR
jgi:hypothetical protein